MFAIVVGQFSYAGRTTETQVIDFSVGTFHYHVARESGDGVQFYILDWESTKEKAEKMRTHYETLRPEWEGLFASSSNFNPVSPDSIRRVMERANDTFSVLNAG